MSAGGGNSALGVEIDYIALARYPSLLESDGAGDSVVHGITACILSVADSTICFAHLRSLDVSTGAQLGAEANVWFPEGPGTPAGLCRLIHSEHLFPGEFLLLGRDLQIQRMPVTVDADGTPRPGPRGLIPAPASAAEVGNGRALVELAPAAFLDREPRLYIGTDEGRVLVLRRTPSGTVFLERTLQATAGIPVSDLGAVPRLGRIDLGVAAGSEVVGLRAGDNSYQTDFSARSPDGRPIRAFKVFNAPDRALTSAFYPVVLTFSDGLTATLQFATLAADAAGSVRMDTVSAAALPFSTSLTGFDRSVLYILKSDQAHVFFRPGYEDGSSVPGCAVNVTDSVPDACVPCPIALTGDVNYTGEINALDIIHLVNFVFKGGAPPRPCEAAGDVDCDGMVAATDVIRTIRYVFRGGPPPCNICTLFAGTWDCP